MVSERDLRQAIEEIESKETNSIDDCQKLAALYAILDKLYKNGREAEPVRAYAEASKPEQDIVIAEVVGDYGDSEFLQALQGFNAEDAWLLVDELMDSLKIVNPRLYDSMMRKIS